MDFDQPIVFDLSPTGQILRNGESLSLEDIAPIVKRADSSISEKVIIRAASGSMAGLATQVMDQAIRGGAQKVKLTPLLSQ